jgi:hypothetical protein
VHPIHAALGSVGTEVLVPRVGNSSKKKKQYKKSSNNVMLPPCHFVLLIPEDQEAKKRLTILSEVNDQYRNGNRG